MCFTDIRRTSSEVRKEKETDLTVVEMEWAMSILQIYFYYVSVAILKVPNLLPIASDTVRRWEGELGAQVKFGVTWSLRQTLLGWLFSDSSGY